MAPVLTASPHSSPIAQSTILKQMRLHHVGGYTDEERDGYREIVYANLVRTSPGPARPLS